MLNKLFAYGPVQILAAFSVFAVLAIQTRFLTLADYGILAFLLVNIEITRLIVSQWVISSFLRLYSSQSDYENKLKLIEMCWIVLLPSILFGCVVLLCLNLYFESWNWWLLCSAIVLFLSKIVFTFQLEQLRLKEKIKLYRIATATQSFLVLVFSFLGLQLTSSVQSAILAVAGSYVIVSVLMFYKGEFSIPRSHSKEKRQQILHYGLPLIGGVALFSIATRIDRFILMGLIPPDQFGIYSAYYNLYYGIFGVIFMIVATPLYPELVKKIEDPDSLRFAHLQYVNLLLFVTLPVVFFLIIFQSEISLIVLGNQYFHEGYWFTIPLLISVYLWNIKGHYFEHAFQFMLKTSKLNLTGLIYLIFCIFFLYILSGKYGVNGAALAMLISVVLIILITVKLANRYNYYFLWDRSTLRIIASAIVIFAFGFFLKAILKNHLVGLMIFFPPAALLVYAMLNKALIVELMGRKR